MQDQDPCCGFPLPNQAPLSSNISSICWAAAVLSGVWLLSAEEQCGSGGKVMGSMRLRSPHKTVSPRAAPEVKTRT